MQEVLIQKMPAALTSGGKLPIMKTEKVLPARVSFRIPSSYKLKSKRPLKFLRLVGGRYFLS